MAQENRNSTSLRPEEIVPGDARLRALQLLQLLREESDEDHPISTSRLTKLMAERFGVRMHRTKIPSDLSALQAAGYDIRVIRTRVCSYYLGSRELDTAELKLLIDSVQASRYISEKRSRELIDKLSDMAGKWQSSSLKRSVIVPNRRKSDGINVFTIVDALHTAIRTGRQTSFLYFRYDRHKRKKPLNEGRPYTVSPWHLIWDSDCYYLLGWCHDRDEVRTFRVDRILKVPELLAEPASRKPAELRPARYTNDAFRMYVEQAPVEVTLKCEEEMMNAVIDRFGRSVPTTAYAGGSFTVTIPVCTGPAFYGWVFASEGGIRITAPESVREEYRQMLRNAPDL